MDTFKLMSIFQETIFQLKFRIRGCSQISSHLLIVKMVVVPFGLKDENTEKKKRKERLNTKNKLNV